MGGYHTNLRCYTTFVYGGCTTGGCKLKQVGPIRMSRDRPTQLDCFRELHTRIQQDHGPKCVSVAQPWQVVSSAVSSTKRPVDERVVSRNANDVLMLRTKIKSLEERVVITNKAVLETEKERDKLHKELELIEVKLEGKRAHTHDDTGDGHDMHTEVDEWDLRDFQRETTRVSPDGRRSSSCRSACGSSTGVPGTTTGTTDSSLNCGCIGFLMICQD